MIILLPHTLIFLFVLIKGRDSSFKDFDYCKAKCIGKGNKHVACQDGISPKPCLIRCPSTYRHYGYVYPTDEQREAILDIHNSYRNKVAGGLETKYGGLAGKKFSNVQIISWNYESEFIASCNAQTCILKHDSCRSLENKTYCGQNGGERTGNTASSSYFEQPNAFNITANNWYNEVKNCEGCDYSKYPPKSLESGNDISHFTQVIWAETTHIGCAYMCFINDEKKEKVVLFCNYCPAGNYRSQPIMLEGDPGPDCGKDKRYPYLCGRQEPLIGAINFSHKQITVMIFICTILNIHLISV